MEAGKEEIVASVEHIARVILFIRGQKVILDGDLAELYGVEIKALNQAVKRNMGRFPADFMFQLTAEETAVMKRHQVTSPGLRSQSVTLKARRGRHRKYLPYVFTEQGVAMLSSVLRSSRAIQVNIEIMRTFVHLRRMLVSHTELAGKLAALERKYDAQFKVVFDAIRELMTPPVPKKKRPIGFGAWEE
jgi:hypothetical protein